MKAVREFKEQWEEQNLLRLIAYYEQAFLFINAASKKFFNVMNTIVFINYLVIKAGYYLLRLLFLNDRLLQLPERDETWMFRQIK